MMKHEVDDLIDLLTTPGRQWQTGLIPDIALPFLRSINASDHLPLGAGLGTAIVGVSREASHIATELGCDNVNDSRRHHLSNFAWPLTEIEAWPEPIKMPGKQGLWNWPEAEDVL